MIKAFSVIKSLQGAESSKLQALRR